MEIESLIQNLCTNENHSSYRKLNVKYEEVVEYMDKFFSDGILKAVYKRLLSDDWMIFTYNYVRQEDDQSEILEAAVSFVLDSGAGKIVLIGASRGGVASIEVAGRSVDNDSIAGVAALSAPIEYEGTVFYTNEDLRGISIPKLLINSESDDGADDTRKMYEFFDKPKDLVFYPGNAHGTELFGENEKSLVEKLITFTQNVFAGRHQKKQKDT